MLWWTCLIFFDGQGWRSGESTRLPPMSPGFPSRRWRHMWVLKFLLALSLAPRGFSPGTPVFPCPKKRTFSKNSNSTRNQVDKEPFSGCATSKSLSIYLFMYLLFLLVILNSSKNSSIGAAPSQMSSNVALIWRRRLFKLRQYFRLNFYFSPVFKNLPAQFSFFFSKIKKSKWPTNARGDRQRRSCRAMR